MAQEHARKREALLTATERDLARVAARVQAKRSPLRGEAESAAHRARARLDGVYVVRTRVPAAALDADETVQAYKDLARATGR